MTITAEPWAATRDLTLRPPDDGCKHPVSHVAGTPDPDGTVRSRCRRAILNPNGPTRSPADVPEDDRCRQPGCHAAWPPLPAPLVPPPTPATLCTTDDCQALATHTAGRPTPERTVKVEVLCEICAVRYRHRHHPAATIWPTDTYRAILARALPRGQLYRIWVGLLADLRPAGVCNAAEARLRLDQVQREHWAVQVFPDGGLRAADPAGSFVGDLSRTLVLQAYPSTAPAPPSPPA